jgi:hypothetical protein
MDTPHPDWDHNRILWETIRVVGAEHGLLELESEEQVRGLVGFSGDSTFFISGECTPLGIQMLGKALERMKL